MQAPQETNPLPESNARELIERGFTIMKGPCPSDGLGRLSGAYDDAVATADAADKRVKPTSTRVWDIVSRGTDFDNIYVYPPLLEACGLVIGQAFKLSATCFRTLEPGAPSQDIHVDVKPQTSDWPILGFILMVDAFEPDNGATRFVPYSHARGYGPDHPDAKLHVDQDQEVLACGSAGSLIIFNGSIWHGHSSNRSLSQRRSIQGHFIPRHGTAALDYGSRLHPDATTRFSGVGKYVLGLASAV